MLWKDFLKRTTSDLAAYLANDIQYSGLPKYRIRQVAWREIEIFLENYKRWSPEKLILNENKKINEKDRKILNKFVGKRKKAIPLAYITGKQEFYGSSFKVDKNTLIPRPETEELVERALNFISGRFKSERRPLVLVDVGTGSGCIIVSAIKHLPSDITDYRAYGIDISAATLKLAKMNAYALLGKQNKIKFIKGSLLNFLKNNKMPQSTFLVILANLPYLSEKEHGHLSREVKNNEPRKALIAGSKGQELILKLLNQIIEYDFRGKIFIELSPAVYPAIKKYCATNAKLLDFRKFADINGNIRFATLNF